MIRIPVRRARAAAAALALTAATVGTTVAVTAPAHATGACTTAVKLTVSHSVIVYGDPIDVEAQVSASGACGSDLPLAGTVQIYKSVQGGAWKPVGTNDTSSYAYYEGMGLVSRNSAFKAVYTGAPDAYGDTYSSSTSGNHRVDVIRKSTYTWKSVRGGVHYNFKISPTSSIRGLKVTFTRKKSTKWVFVKSARVSSTGHVQSTFGLGTYKLNMPASRGMAASYHKFGVVRARAAHARVVSR